MLVETKIYGDMCGFLRYANYGITNNKTEEYEGFHGNNLLEDLKRFCTD